MHSSTENGEKRPLEDRIKHPDLFPDLRAKMKGAAPPSKSTPPPTELTRLRVLQKHTSTKQRKGSTTSRARSANFITSSTPIIGTTRRMRRKLTRSVRVSLRATVSSHLHQKEMGIGSSGMSTAVTTSGPCQSHWKRPRKQSTLPTGG